jgi:hypothetical protein
MVLIVLELLELVELSLEYLLHQDVQHLVEHLRAKKCEQPCNKDLHSNPSILKTSTPSFTED